MANLRYATARRNAMMDDARTALAGGSIKVYSGTQPANANTALKRQHAARDADVGEPRRRGIVRRDVYLWHHHERHCGCYWDGELCPRVSVGRHDGRLRHGRWHIRRDLHS
jgi:hypothetical protein